MSASLKSCLLAALTALASLGGVGSAAAQDFTFGWNPRSGDVWVDTWLGDMNRYGSRYRDPFVDELVRYHGAPRDLVVDLLVQRRWAPGDVYFACALASIIGRPCRYVVDIWERDHALGWGRVAQNLGIKPGSPEFHRLKKGLVPTYDRWGRPIALDAQLERDFPGRGKGAAGKAGTGQPAKGKGAARGDRPDADARPAARGAEKPHPGKARGNKAQEQGHGPGKGKG